MERFINGFLDLITIWFLSRFGKRPMHLFGAMGSLMFIIGFFMISGLWRFKLYHMFMNMRYSLVTNNPWFFYCLNHHGIGTQLFWLVFLKSFYEQKATKNVIKFQVRLIYNMPSPDSSENPFMLGSA
jgi:hypothetical protein